MLICKCRHLIGFFFDVLALFEHLMHLLKLMVLMLLFFPRVQLNEAQDEIMKKKELLEDLQPDATQTS